MLSLSDWITTLTLVFGGCCSNAITTERLTSESPRSGILITFFQFFIVSLYALPSQLTFSVPIQTAHTDTHLKQHEIQGHEKTLMTAARTAWLPRFKKRRVPLLPYLVQVALFFVLSVLNNAAFAYDIPMTVHIIFRSGGMVINMLLGWFLVNKRYTPKQIVSLFTVTFGIILTTLSASKPGPNLSNAQLTGATVSLYAQGVAILSLALLLSGFLGLSQDYVFAQYIRPYGAQTTSDPLAQPSWQENMFYIHALPLPLFYFSRESIATEFTRLSASPNVSLTSVPPLDNYPTLMLGSAAPLVPSMFLYLFVNTVTQVLCVIGVNRLTGRVSSLAVSLILTVRKAVSLLLSVAVYGGQANPMMWIGAALVFAGTIGYSTGARPKVKDKKD